MNALVTIDRALCAGVDPFFGAPLSPREWRLWESILLGGKRNHRTWKDVLRDLGLKFFQPGSNPFGASSGGAGGNVNTPEAVGSEAPKKSFGNSYPWLYPTSDFQNFDKYGTLALPAAGTLTLIGGTITNNAITTNAASNMPWIVPTGFNGFIKTIALDFVANGGAAWTQGVLPPGLEFSLQVNNFPAFDYGMFFYSPGLIIAPTPIAGVPIKEQNLVAMYCENLTIAVTTQFVEARLQGYYYGKEFEPKELAF